MQLTVCAATVAGIATAAIGPRASAAGDPAAKADAIAAFQKLNFVPSYRIKWASAEGTGVAEIVQPDKRHFVGKSARGSVEIFEIGTEHSIHYDFPGAPSGWRCTKSRKVSTYFDIDKMRTDTTTDVIRKPDTVIDGTPAHVFADANTGDELYVSAPTGLPRRVRWDPGHPEKSVTADFYDYGAPITITPPPCG
jgi:hypothetical protein